VRLPASQLAPRAARDAILISCVALPGFLRGYRADRNEKGNQLIRDRLVTITPTIDDGRRDPAASVPCFDIRTPARARLVVALPSIVALNRRPAIDASRSAPTRRGV